MSTALCWICGARPCSWVYKMQVRQSGDYLFAPTLTVCSACQGNIEIPAVDALVQSWAASTPFDSRIPSDA